ncbi:hypothetical protein BST29_24145 [Mycobacterium malmoense]|uniref:PE domain-containing protein n=1 Tax=Mycobacterium malmoense TaxID=1780 RepID=A0ABX3SKI8_MYCMA|nr:hypothetical protein BST29_24145 [Mycobacterium malmoense]
MRPYLAGGVALVGASLVAVNPITSNIAANIQERAVRLTSTVTDDIGDLTTNAATTLAGSLDFNDLASAATAATTGPITSWIDVFTNAVSNFSQIGQDYFADPLPVLSQFLINQFGYAGDLATGIQGVANALSNQFTTALPEAFHTAFGDITSGDLPAAAQTINEALTTVVLVAGLPLLESGALNIPSKMAQNFANVVTSLTSFGTLLPLLEGVLGPPLGTIAAFADSGQSLIDAVGAGDTQGAITALLDTPANVAGAFINGYDASFGTDYPGLLTPEGVTSFGVGPVYALLVEIPQQIAQAIGASAASSSAAAAMSLDPSSLATDLAAVFNPAAITDIGSLLATNLAPNLGGLVVDLLSLL